MYTDTQYLYFNKSNQLGVALRKILKGAKALYIADEHIAPLFEKTFAFSPDVVVPSGEKAKSLDTLTRLWDELMRRNASRKDYLVSFGGGSVSDVVGFAASTFKRGMGLIHIPTTLLATVDASAGGKTGVNFGDMKNGIGTFYPPHAVLIAFNLLETLPQEEWISGQGEMVKIALLTGTDPVKFIAPSNLIDSIRVCIDFKAEVTKEDLYDEDRRQILNLGHTAGHALEAYHLAESINGGYPHGLCVASGLVIESYISFALGLLSQKDLMHIAHFVRDYFPPIPIPCKSYDQIWALARKDKKNQTPSQDATITLTLLKRLGEPITGIRVDRKTWDEALDFYKDFFGV